MSVATLTMARLAPSVTASIVHAPSERLPVQNQPAMMKNFFKICKFSLFVWFLLFAASLFYGANFNLNLACIEQICPLCPFAPNLRPPR